MLSIIDWLALWVQGPRILDIGSYFGWYGLYYKLYKTTQTFVVGCDLHLPSLKYAKQNLDDAVLCDVRYLPFKDECFDDGLCVEVIEHLPKKDGIKMINEAIRVCNRIFLTTPNIRSEGDQRLFDANPLMRHLSLYTHHELKRLGASKVRGIGWKSRKTSLLHLIFWFIPYKFPKFSNTLIAIFTK